jgi:PKD repeat protein
MTVHPTTGQVFVVDQNNGGFRDPVRTVRVKKFTSTGALPDPAQTLNVVATETLPFLPQIVVDIAVNPTNDVLYLLVESGLNAEVGGTPLEIWAFASAATGDASKTVMVLDSGTPATDDDLNQGSALAVNPASGNLYVAGNRAQDGQLWRLNSAGVKQGTATATGFTSVSDMGFHDSKLFLLGLSDVAGPPAARVRTLSATLGAVPGDTSLDATDDSGPRPFGPGFDGRGLAIEPDGALLLPAVHRLQGGTTDGETNVPKQTGVSRYASIAATSPEKYWGNTLGSESCQFATSGGAIAFNPVSSEVLAADQSTASSNSGVRRIQRFKSGGTGCGFADAKAEFSVSANPAAGQNITFTSLSTLPTRKPAFTGTFTNYRWDFGNDGTFDVEGSAPVRQLPKGTVAVRLRVEVSNGDAAEVVKNVVVKGPAPTAAFTAAPGTPRVGDAVAFDASASTPAPDGSKITSYRWDFDGDGTYDTAAAASPTATYTYSGARSYRAKLEVRDSGGESDTEERTITVSAAAIPPAPPAPPASPAPPIVGQGPADLTAPLFSLTGGRISVDRQGRFSYKLTCPAVETSCSFVVAVATQSKKKPLRLASGRLTVAGGKSSSVRLKVSAAGLKALKKAKRLPVRFTVDGADAAGNKAQKTQTATLLAARRR